MSYDLMIFQPDQSMGQRQAFLAWYDGTANSDEAVDLPYEQVAQPIRELVADLTERFSAMDGPLAKADLDFDDPCVTQYEIGRAFVYACFAWSQAELAYRTLFALAEKHGLGFYDVSGRTGQEVWAPGGAGKFTLLHEHA